MKKKIIAPGFSLVELLVATTVLVMIVALLASVVSGVSSAWRESIGRSERGVHARAIAEFIRSDLSSALIPVDEAAQNSLQFVLNPANLSSEYKNGDALFWQAPIAADRVLGDIAEVGYFVRWVKPNATPKPILCRFFVNPGTRDPNGLPILNPNFRIYSRPDEWITNDLIESLAPGINSGPGNSGYDGLFAENVAGIWFRCFDSAGKALSRNFDSRIGEEDSYPDPVSGLRSWRRLPSSVQLSFVLIDSTVARRLNVVLQTNLTGLANRVSADVTNNSPNDDTVSPAHEFVKGAEEDTQFRAVSSHLRAFTTNIHLSNSR